MKAELTAEKRPAYLPSGSVLYIEGGIRTTHEDKGGVQVLVVFPRVISVKLLRLFAVHCEEVGPRVISPNWIEELLENRMEAGGRFSDCPTLFEWTQRTSQGRYGQPPALARESSAAFSLRVRIGSYLMIVADLRLGSALRCWPTGTLPRARRSPARAIYG